MFSQNNNTFIRFGFFVAFGLIYLLLPTQNSSLDGYAYAHMIRSGDMFMHHHLLYNALGFCVMKLLNVIVFFPDVLALMKVVNALFAVGCLMVFLRIIVRLKSKSSVIARAERNFIANVETHSPKQSPFQHEIASGNSIFQQLKNLFSPRNDGNNEAFAFTALAASCFGLMRFATENENYIIPIFFSLLGSLFLLFYFKNHSRINIVLASLFMASACLFHQVHVWWWLAGLLVFIKKKNIIYYLLPALIVPAVYAVVVVSETGSLSNFFDYVFYDYLHGSASISWSWMDIPLAGISLVRSFVQVHGSMAIQVQHSWWWVLPALVSVACMFFALRGIRKWGFRANPNIRFFGFVSTAFLLHFGFAELCHGNAEFMVMLPLLLILALASILNIPVKNLSFASASLLIWNVNFGLLPAHIYNFENKQKQAAFIHQYPETPFVANDYWYAWNVYTYIYTQEPSNLYSGIVKGAKPLSTQKWNMIFTDKGNTPLVLNRKALVDEKTEESAFLQSGHEVVDSIVGYWGVQYIHRVKRK